MVRAKMKLIEATQMSWSPTAQKLVFAAEYDQSIPEDQRFAKATPSARLEMQVDNPAALEQLGLGKTYYVDFTPVPPA